MPDIDKKQILAALASRLGDQLRALVEAQKAVQAGATHPEARQEHPKDTRSTEAGYLARGLAERVETLRDEIRALQLTPCRSYKDDEAAGPGALVAVTDDKDARRLYLLAPAGGGERIPAGEEEVLVLTPRSPLGAAIAGRSAGDSILVELPAGPLRAEIEEIW